MSAPRLEPGTQLGPYVILEWAGAGGMGSVYKARDTRLGRTVAVKTVDGRFTDRFEREAKTIASIAHPHVCTLHDVGPGYLVMEYIEGAPLKGPLPVDEVVRLGAQIADALAEAHKKGLVHRDLKPGNILVTDAGVKVIDFGLAKHAIAPAPGPDESTAAAPVTGEGTVLGTAPYMSPEQAQGKDVDARSDIFSLGAVLYEMVTGSRAFDAESRAGLAAAILERDPPPLGPDQAPAWLDRLIRRCLRKRPDDRWQSARDIAIELREPRTAESAALPVAPPRAPRWIWPAMAALAAVTVGVGWKAFGPKPSATRPNYWVTIPAPVGLEDAPTASIYQWRPELSPNGKMVAVADRQLGIRVRSLDARDWKPLPGTEGAWRVRWSPDSLHLAFRASGKLKRVDLERNVIRTICESEYALGEFVWSAGGAILLMSLSGEKAVLMSVPDTGGEPVPVPGAESTDTRPWGIEALPRGGYLYTTSEGTYAARSTREPPRRIGAAFGFSPRFVAPRGGGAGQLLFGQGTRIMARPFDPERLDAGASAAPVLDGVHSDRLRASYFSVSTQGELLFRPAVGLRRRFRWMSRAGATLSEFGEPGEYDYPRLSPDGKDVVYSVRDPDSGAMRAFVAKSDGLSPRLLSKGPISLRHAWSPDGTKVASREDGKLVVRSVRSPEDARTLETGLTTPTPLDWPADGQRVVIKDDSGTLEQMRVFTFALTPGAKPELLRARTADALLSPNGRYLAYGSTGTPGGGLGLLRNPPTNESWPIPAVGLTFRWGRGGRELYILSGNRLLAVPVRLDGPTPEIGQPQVLFELADTGARIAFDATADGEKFLVVVAANDAGRAPDRGMTLVTDWRSLLDKPVEPGAN